MARYDKLLAAITCGYNIDKKSNVVFADWTPHNIRRVVIGIDKAIVQYHVTGGKFNSLTRIVDYSNFVESELNMFFNGEGKNLKPLIGVLVDARICSAVEEIVFCTEGYNSNLLSFDSNKSALLKGTNVDPSNRFPRLAKIYCLGASVSKIEQLVRNSIDPVYLLYDELKKKNAPISKVENLNAKWYEGNTKFWNPNIYQMDAEGGTLQNRLAKVKSKYDEYADSQKRADAESNRDKKILDKLGFSYTAFSGVLLKEDEKMCSYPEKLSRFSRMTFGKDLSKAGVKDAFNKVYRNDLKDLKQVDFDTVRSMLESDGYDTRAVDIIEFYTSEVKGPKADKVNSLKEVINYIAIILNLYNSILFKAVYDYLTQYDTKNVRDMALKLTEYSGISLSEIKFNTRVSNYINSFNSSSNLTPGSVLMEAGFVRATSEDNRGFNNVQKTFSQLDNLITSIK